MTGTPLLIGQIVTLAIFIAVGVGLVWWLFRPSATREPTAPIEESLRPPPEEGAPRIRVRAVPPAADRDPPPR